MKINPSYRYPLFFSGAMLAIASAFLHRIGLPGTIAAMMAVVGFALFVLSIVLP